MMTAQEIRRLVEQHLQPKPPGESYKSLAEKLVRELRRNRQAYEPEVVRANRLPAAYVRPSVLHFGRRQNPRRGPLNTSKEVARRKLQAFVRAEKCARKILNFGKPGGVQPAVCTRIDWK